MSINLAKVPYIKQSYEFDCWYTSLRMIVKTYFPNAEPASLHVAEVEGMESARIRGLIWSNETGRRKTRLLNETENLPRGLRLEEIPELARLNGLRAVPLPSPDRDPGFTYTGLASLLQMHGPLWCLYSQPSLHAVVVKGSMPDHLLVHDPMFGADLHHAIDQFNAKLKWTANSVLYLDVFGKEYPADN